MNFAKYIENRHFMEIRKDVRFIRKLDENKDGKYDVVLMSPEFFNEKSPAVIWLNSLNSNQKQELGAMFKYQMTCDYPDDIYAAQKIQDWIEENYGDRKWWMYFDFAEVK